MLLNQEDVQFLPDIYSDLTKTDYFPHGGNPGHLTRFKIINLMTLSVYPKSLPSPAWF